MRLWILALAWLFGASFAAHADELPQDAFQRADALKGVPADDVHRLAQDVKMGRPNAAARLQAWLTDHAEAAADRKAAWVALCDEHSRRFRYTAAVEACSYAEEGSDKPPSPNSTVGLMRVLADEKPVTWDRTGLRVALRAGHITIARGAESVEALVDTGAEIAVVMESVARRLGARPLKGSVSIGSTTTPVAGGIVMFDELKIGGSTLRHLPALVMSDTQLTIPNGPTLRFIFSLPALTAAGRVAFLDRGRTLALGDAAPEASRDASVPLYWDDLGVGFAADFGSGRRGVHFDTGSNATWLFPIAESALSPAERATRTTIQRRIGGLGGDRMERATKFTGVNIRVAGHDWRFPSIEMSEKDEHGEAARIGIGLIDRFKTVTLDFANMRLEVGE